MLIFDAVASVLGALCSGISSSHRTESDIKVVTLSDRY